MTIRKKLNIGVGLTAGFLLFFCLLFTNSLSVNAYNSTEVNSASFAFKNPKTITMTIRRAGPTPTSPGVNDKYDFVTDGTFITFPTPHLVFNLSTTNSPQYECTTAPAATLAPPITTSILIYKNDLDALANGATNIAATEFINYKQGGGCVSINGGNGLSKTIAIPAGMTIYGAGAGGTTGGGAGGTDDACVSSGWALSWIACPVITAAQTAANSMYGFVEDQLKFRVPDDLGGQQGAVHNTWNNFRVIVSGLVVILMLVMVISQAVGGGPFDAYTIKKMLPRLVIGVILIQISWPLFSWVVNTVDDLGRGLADLMYAPFGGTSALDLNHVMGQFTPEAIAFSWVGIPALVVFGVVAPFVVLGLILTVLVAIFMGFLALLFRKILIILALIFVPVALIAWMMPSDGLRRYWKLWQDNFLKALLMYPLIVVIIAGGRIFAKIGSNQSDFVGFFIVLIGFFGPLFILPKTFKWGGTAMQLAGNALTKAQVAGLKKPREALQSAQKAKSEQKAAEAGLRWANNKPSFLRGDYFRANQWTKAFTPGKSMEAVRKRQLAALRAKGAALEGEEQKQRSEERQSYAARLKRLETELANPEGDSTDFYTAVANGELDAEFGTHSGRRTIRDILETGEVSHTMRQAAMKHLTTEGQSGLRALDRIRNDALITNDTEFRRAFEEFRIENGEQMFRVLPHWYKPTENVANDTKPEAFTTMAAVEAEAIVGELSHKIQIGGTEQEITSLMERRGLSRPEAIDETKQAAARSMADFLQSFEAATRDETIRGHIDKGAANVVLSYMQGSGTNFGEVNRSMAGHAPNEQMAIERQMVAGGYGTQREQLQDAVAQRYPADQAAQGAENFNTTVSRIVDVVHAGGQVRITAPEAPPQAPTPPTQQAGPWRPPPQGP